MTPPSCFPAAGVLPLIVVVFAFGAAFGVLSWMALKAWLTDQLHGDES